MLAFSDRFPLALAGLTFTILGGHKLWGLNRVMLNGQKKEEVPQ